MLNYQNALMNKRRLKLKDRPLSLPVIRGLRLKNTITMQTVLDHLRTQKETLNDEDIARLSALCLGHINMLGHYIHTGRTGDERTSAAIKERSEDGNIA